MANGLSDSELKDFLDEKSFQYNQKRFIETDPIKIPHQFFKKEDIVVLLAKKDFLHVVENMFRISSI